MSKRFAAAFILGKSLFPSETPEAERVTRLKPFFDPPLGAMATLDSTEMHKAVKDPIRTRGFIVVTPPKGRCWIIKRHPELPDAHVCQRTTLNFEAGAIDDAGRVTWEIITGEGDFGTPVSWPTPYRLAQVIPNGEFAKQLGNYIPMTSCIADKVERVIRVELLNGEKWAIYFPEKDTLVYPQPEDMPNLHLHRVAESTAFKPKDNSPPPPAPPGVEKYTWVLPARRSFAMSASAVKMADSPDGLNGLCRYRLVDTPRDPKSGALECFNTEKYDAIYLPLTCAPALR